MNYLACKIYNLFEICLQKKPFGIIIDFEVDKGFKNTIFQSIGQIVVSNFGVMFE
jgi:hypothetical protein